MTTGSQDGRALNPFLEELRDLQKYAAQLPAATTDKFPHGAWPKDST